VAVVEAKGTRLVPIEHGVIKIPQRVPLSECLGRLSREIAEIVDRAHPGAVAVEGVFYCKNARTALILGHSRGVAIAACAGLGLPVYEYAPRRVKQAVVGYGAASKEQVRRMVVSLLGLREAPREDAGDALAIAICHLHNATRHRLLAVEPI
jgi:crossover junction endodeoxyribonuclease RuvC